MSTIRVPYPADPEQRRGLFERAAAKLARFGEYEGTPDAGTFHGRTPFGEFAGSYRSEVGAQELVIELTRKPWLVPTVLIESEVRKHMAQV
jgi:hypothetical protein